MSRRLPHSPVRLRDAFASTILLMVGGLSTACTAKGEGDVLNDAGVAAIDAGAGSIDAGRPRDDGGPLRCGLVCPEAQVCRDGADGQESCIDAIALSCEADADCTDGNDTQMRCLEGVCVDDVFNDNPTFCGNGEDGAPCAPGSQAGGNDCATGNRCFIDEDIDGDCSTGTCRPEQGSECVASSDCDDPNETGEISCVDGYCYLDW